MTTSVRKPHNNNAGYVAELKAKLGGHIVIYDARLAEIDADDRWVVMHEPSSRHVSIRALRHARTIMKWVANATTREDAKILADILPEENES